MSNEQTILAWEDPDFRDRQGLTAAEPSPVGSARFNLSPSATITYTSPTGITYTPPTGEKVTQTQITATMPFTVT
jgi:hypothetical protein